VLFVSRGLLGGKESEGEAGAAAPAASLFAAPRGGARRRLIAAVNATAPEPAPKAAPAPAAEEPVLFNKGDASASGFRPWYWSYERDGAPPPSDSAGSVTPFPASAPSPVSSADPVSAPAISSPAAPRKRRGLVPLAGTVVLALGAAGFFLLVPQHGAPPGPPPTPQVVALAAPAPAVIAPAPAPPAAPPAPVAAPAPAPAPAKPLPAIAPEEMAELMARGNQMLATGDIAAARLFFERAAQGGNAAAALAAGKTYDPLFLEAAHARGIRGDPVAAARWYRQASAGGDPEADGLMKRLMARYAG